MESIGDVFSNKFAYLPILVWIGIQLFKVIWDAVVDKKFDFKRILSAGGMPSSHSAVVCSLTIFLKEILLMEIDNWEGKRH